MLEKRRGKKTKQYLPNRLRAWAGETREGRWEGDDTEGGEGREEDKEE